MTDLGGLLDAHGIRFVRHDHPPVSTCEEELRHVPESGAARTKNLFTRDRRGRRIAGEPLEHLRVELVRRVEHLDVTTNKRLAAWGAGCPVVSPDVRYLYFTSDRGFADKPLEAALSTREWNARFDSPGNGLGYTWCVPTSAVFEALGRTPR